MNLEKPGVGGVEVTPLCAALSQLGAFFLPAFILISIVDMRTI
jgi:hypothetical protein